MPQHVRGAPGAFSRHPPVKDRGLDVRQDHAREKLEDAAFDEGQLINRLAAVRFDLGQHPDDDRLVRLLVQFGQLDRPHVIVPALVIPRSELAPA